MISYTDALHILRQTPSLPSITIAGVDACGFVLASTVMSQIAVPPFANAGMDGFAVRSRELAGAGTAAVLLKVMGSSRAGDKPAVGGGDAGGAWEIMTGAPVPRGYDAVVKIEAVEVGAGVVSFTAPIAAGENIRAAGADFAVGDVIAVAGTKLTPFHIMALAACGVDFVRVHRKPRVLVLNTGKELATSAGAKLKAGQIYNANGPYLIAALKAAGYSVEDGGAIEDNGAALEDKIKNSTTDIIVSTGAVSAGKFDFIPDALKKMGAKILFHKVAVRPGKPILYARLAGGTGAHYFGFPGNPMSAAVGLRFFAVPLLRALQGTSPVEEVPTTAMLVAPFRKNKGMRVFCKAHVADGKVTILDGQESFKVRAMLKANCWAVVEERAEEVAAGVPVRIKSTGLE